MSATGSRHRYHAEGAVKGVSTLTTTRVLSFWLILLAAVSYGYFVYNLALDDLKGGHEWKQGDWLINSVNDPVRRSLTGDVAIWLADVFTMDPVRVVVIGQVLLVAVLYALLLRLIFTSRDKLALIILAMSPAFFMTFWIADPLGSARKEMFTFLGLLVFALGMRRDGIKLSVLGCAIFVLSVIIHEAMILFAPVLWGIWFLSRSSAESERLLVVILATTSALSVLAFVAALGKGQVDDFMSVCEPLLKRGVKEHMCHGSIRWLEYDLSYVMGFVASRTTGFIVFLLVLTYTLCLLPGIYLVYLSDRRWLSFALTIGPFFCFLPLFMIAVDHGRWISFHILSSLLLYAVALAHARIRIVHGHNAFVLVALIIVSLLFAPTHIRDVYWGGVIMRAVEEFAPHWVS